MHHGGRKPAALEKAPELLDEAHRAVASPRTADGDGQVRLALALIRGQEKREQILEPPEQLPALLVLQDERAHPLVAPVQRAQLVDEVGVRQEADIEHEVRVDGNAVLEPEGDQRGGQAGASLGRAVQRHQELLELVDGERRGIDDAIGDPAQVGKRLALGEDPVQHLTVAGQRMPTTALVIAADERLVARLEEQHLDRVSPRPQLADGVDQMRQVLAGANVDAQGHPVGTLLRAHHQVGEGRDQGGGQVVDAEEPHVLEALDGEALPGAGDPGDHDERDGARHAQPTGSMRPNPPSRRRYRTFTSPDCALRKTRNCSRPASSCIRASSTAIGLATRRRGTISSRAGGSAAAPPRRTARPLLTVRRSLASRAWRLSASTASSRAVVRSPVVASLVKVRRRARSVIRALRRNFSATHMTRASTIWGSTRLRRLSLLSISVLSAGVSATPRPLRMTCTGAGRSRAPTSLTGDGAPAAAGATVRCPALRGTWRRCDARSRGRVP